MADLAGFPFASVQFTKDGAIHDQAELDALLTLLGQGQVTDLFAMSHGWNNDMPDARALYERLLESVRATINGGQLAGVSGRRFAVLGIFWPSKKFAESELIPSGAASAGSAV